MLADLIFLTTSHPFITGVLVGAVCIGGPVAAICWQLGYDACARNVWAQMVEEDEAHGDVPNLPRRAS